MQLVREPIQTSLEKVTKANTRCDWVYFQFDQFCSILFCFLFKARGNGLLYNISNLICLNVFSIISSFTI